MDNRRFGQLRVPRNRKITSRLELERQATREDVSSSGPLLSLRYSEGSEQFLNRDQNRRM